MTYYFSSGFDSEIKQALVQDLGLAPDAEEFQIADRLALQSVDAKRVNAAREFGLPETATWADIEAERSAQSRGSHTRLKRGAPAWRPFMKRHLALAFAVLTLSGFTSVAHAASKDIPPNLPQPPYILPHPGDGGCTFPDIQNPPIPCNGPLDPPAPPKPPIIDIQPGAIPDHPVEQPDGQ
jgi:hypothetical protein